MVLLSAMERRWTGALACLFPVAAGGSLRILSLSLVYDRPREPLRTSRAGPM